MSKRVDISKRIMFVPHIHQSAILWIDGHRVELSNYETERLYHALGEALQSKPVEQPEIGASA
jgi:hypothetical protein